MGVYPLIIVEVPDSREGYLRKPWTAGAAQSAAAGERPRVQEAGQEWFRELYERHSGEVLRYAIRCTGRREVAEELAGDAFLRLYRHREEVELERAGAWLTATVKNLATDYWRRRQLERRLEREVAAALSPVMPPAMRGERWLEHPVLKPEHRACLTLHYFHGMSAGEIADHTGLSGNQVKNALQYGLKLLRQVFGGKDGQR